MAYDDVLEIAGNGAFQWRLFVVFFINGIPNALITTALIFLHYFPFKHECGMPETITKNINESSSLWNATLDFMIPLEEETGERSRCRIYNRSVHEVDAFLNRTLTGNVSPLVEINSSSSAVTCDNGLIYHREYNIESAAIEFGWVCDRSWLKPLASSLFIVGMGIGSFAGFFSDRYGRRPIFLIFTFLQFVAFIILSFATSTWVYMIFMLMSGCVTLVNYLAGFVLAAECTMPNKRNLLSISSFFSFSAGYASASLTAYLIPNWRWLLRCYGLFGILFIPNVWLVPESPRWLMSNGRVEEAKKVFIEMANVNKRAGVTDRLLREVEKEAIALMEEEGGTGTSNNVDTWWNTMKEIVKSPAMICIMLVLIFSWFCAALVYYGIALNVQAFTGNMYINNLLVGLMEIPALIGAYLTVRYLSRPLSHGGSMIISGIFCMGAGLLNTVSGQAATIAGLLGKAINSGAFYLVYIHTTETSPTLSRNSCMCIGSLAGRIGSFISPYFAYLVELYGMFGPYLTMSLVTIASGILTLLFVPETRLVELPETVQDSLALETVFSRFWGRKSKNGRNGGGKARSDEGEALNGDEKDNSASV